MERSAVVSDQSIWRCPLTLEFMTSPMTHSTCKHRVDLTSLEHLLKQRLTAKCPVPGCAAVWKKGDAEVDLEMKTQIRSRQKAPPPTISTRVIDLCHDSPKKRSLPGLVIDLVSDDEDDDAQRRKKHLRRDLAMLTDKHRAKPSVSEKTKTPLPAKYR